MNQRMNGMMWSLAMLLLVGQASAAVFQYAIPLEGNRPGMAHLWIPPQAKQVRGVVVAPMTLAEREIAKDPQIRAACAEQQLAILFIRGAAEPVGLLEQFAKLSGYQELAVAPLFFVGHSAGGPPAKANAIKHAQRCFGLMQYRGGVPGGGEPLTAGVPTLTMIGQFDEFGGLMRDAEGREGAWERGREDIVAYRSRSDSNLASLVVEPGAGHFAWSDRNAAYLALFLKKAAAARIPDWPVTATEPVVCRAVDPASGWLTDLSIKTPGKFPLAPYAQYQGERGQAAWHFDRELAEATVAYHAGFGKKDQFIRWTDGYWIDAGARFFFTGLKWVGDGQTFQVHPVYAAQYPEPHKSGGPRWLEAGQPVGQAEAPILVKPVSGPIVATSTNTFRIQFDAVTPASDGAGRTTFMAYSQGDATYRYTEQVGMMPRGFGGPGGKPQTISFPALGHLQRGAAPVELKATSDSGLPVEYYVAHGPAVVRDGKLEIAEVPARAQFPIKIAVVAWQYGSGLAPQFRPATPVTQEILLEK